MQDVPTVHCGTPVISTTNYFLIRLKAVTYKASNAWYFKKKPWEIAHICLLLFASVVEKGLFLQ